MKYWNKDKSVRQRCWTKVQLPKKWEAGPNGSAVAWPHSQHAGHEIKRWLQQQDSTGKFYHYYGANSWWFENEQDATIFLLKWS